MLYGKLKFKTPLFLTSGNPSPLAQDFVCARNDIALDVGHAVDGVKDKSNSNSSSNGATIAAAGCNKCRKPILASGGGGGSNAMAVIAPRFGIATMWHPGCFTCTTCDELLVSLA